MADFFEKSFKSVKSSELDNFDTYAVDLNKHIGKGDISIFSVDQSSYQETLDNICCFLENDSIVNSIDKEKDRIMKQLYGDINNFEVVETNIFLNGTS